MRFLAIVALGLLLSGVGTLGVSASDARHLSGVIEGELTQARAGFVVSTGANCAVLRGEQAWTVLGGTVRAEWEALTPLTSTLRLRSGVTGGSWEDVVGASPLELPIAASAVSDVWLAALELPDAGASIQQPLTLTYALDVVGNDGEVSPAQCTIG